MQKTFNFRLLPSEAMSDSAIKNHIAKSEGIELAAVKGYNILKRSIDARGRQPWINLSLQAFINEQWSTKNILYDSHPHIGTNKLPGIITAIRKQLLDSGAEIFFDRKVTDLVIAGSTLTGVKTLDGNVFDGDAVILATGHSARDIFQLLYDK